MCLSVTDLFLQINAVKTNYFLSTSNRIGLFSWSLLIIFYGIHYLIKFGKYLLDAVFNEKETAEEKKKTITWVKNKE